MIKNHVFRRNISKDITFRDSFRTKSKIFWLRRHNSGVQIRQTSASAVCIYKITAEIRDNKQQTRRTAINIVLSVCESCIFVV